MKYYFLSRSFYFFIAAFFLYLATKFSYDVVGHEANLTFYLDTDSNYFKYVILILATLVMYDGLRIHSEEKPPRTIIEFAAPMIILGPLYLTIIVSIPFAVFNTYEELKLDYANSQCKQYKDYALSECMYFVLKSDITYEEYKNKLIAQNY